MTNPGQDGPEQQEDQASGQSAGKVEKLADEALEAGRKLAESETGRKVVGAAETVFDKAEDLAKQALDSDLARTVGAKAGELADKVLDTDAGRKAADRARNLGHQALDSDAGTTAKKIWETPLGRNVGTGAAAGAVLGLVIPFVGPLLGAAAGGGLGYLRTLAKKNKQG